MGRLGALWGRLGPDFRSKMKPDRSIPVGVSWRRLGDALGASWSALERLRAVLDRLGSVLGASWRRSNQILEVFQFAFRLRRGLEAKNDNFPKEF